MDFESMEKDLLEAEICFKTTDGATVHAPVTIHPTPFPEIAFARAVQLQPTFNLLVLRTIQNSTMLHQVCSQLAQQDEFVKNLYNIYLKYPEIPKLFFNVNRSDYMVEKDRIFQIELNTISASLAGLSSKLAQFHQNKYPELKIPDNYASTGVGKAFESAINLYKKEYDVVKDPVGILFIVQEGERNIYDQIHLQRTINQDIPIIRKSLKDPLSFKVDSQGILKCDSIEIGLIYYRAGYSPCEYENSSYWESRERLESTRAIKCPDIASHLAGLKKIQQVIASPQNLLLTMKNDSQLTNDLLSSFAGIYSLDDTEEGQANTEMALKDPERFVLKPQREGGGNNTYGLQVRAALQEMTAKQRSAFILMDRIRPNQTSTTILRNSTKSQISAISELGIYGAILARTGEYEEIVVLNEQVGWLLRTKPEDSDEGGVVSGFSVLDAPNLCQ